MVMKPPYVLCPHQKNLIQFIFSTAIDGKIKLWLYDFLGSRLNFDAPQHWRTTTAYSADESRLFSCGTSKEGDPHLVEWNDSEGTIKRKYYGFGKGSIGVVQFDTTRNRFLAAGDEFLIKFWDMDNRNIVTTVDADGGLPVEEHVDRMPSAVSMSNMVDTDSIVKSWKLANLVDPSQLKALKLPDSRTTSKVVRLLHMDSGIGVLALCCNASHKLWKWQLSERNPSGKSSASVAPHLWQPSDGVTMNNHTNPRRLIDESTACFAMSENGSYLFSASGGKVSVFMMTTFKVIATFMSSSPAATCVALYPEDNNILAIGSDDSNIRIYDINVDKIKAKLKGHQKKITGLAFSSSLNVLVSSGADAQLCVWCSDGWEKKKSGFLEAQSSEAGPLVGETKVRFHKDEAHLLVDHESQLSIYDVNLECLCSWYPKDSLSAPISCATYSCDSLLVFAGFRDSAVGVFDADRLILRCRIAHSAYIASHPIIQQITIGGEVAYPSAISAHPSDPNQIALGMSDGFVFVLEPSEGDSKWRESPPPPQEKGTNSTGSSSTSCSSCCPFFIYDTRVFPSWS